MKIQIILTNKKIIQLPVYGIDKEGVRVEGTRLNFDFGSEHTYLQLGDNDSLNHPPKTDYYHLQPSKNYSLKGKAEINDKPAEIWLIEYDKNHRIYYTKITIKKSGDYCLSWQTHKRYKFMRVAIRVTGNGFLELNNLEIRKSLRTNIQNLKISEQNITQNNIFGKLKLISRLAYNYWYDFYHFTKHSSTLNILKNKSRLESRVIVSSHGIEKGFSFRSMKYGFGKAHVSNLLSYLGEYISKYGHSVLIAESIKNLEHYYQINRKKNLHEDYVKKRIDEWKPNIPNKLSHHEFEGALLLEKNEIIKTTSIDFSAFVKSRHSIRDYADNEISNNLILKAVEIAKYSPSVCNRQPWQTHVYTGDLKNKMLSLQRGNRGFGHTANKLILVTCEQSSFFGAAERNQIFIDGGLFSMTLIFALHSMSIGACSLSMANDFVTEKKIKKLGNIGKSQRLIMMISVGALQDSFKVATSNRKETNEFIKFH